jgi:DNA-binding XRE family transcriptional regulator
MGFKLKECRENAKMSQMELSKKSGVSRGTIISIENNSAKNTSTKVLAKLAKALGVSISDIFFANSV